MGRAIDMERDIDVLKKEVGEIKSMLKEIMEGVDGGKKETKKANAKRSKKSSGLSDTRPEPTESKD